MEEESEHQQQAASGDHPGFGGRRWVAAGFAEHVSQSRIWAHFQEVTLKSLCTGPAPSRPLHSTAMVTPACEDAELPAPSLIVSTTDTPVPVGAFCGTCALIWYKAMYCGVRPE